jgi:type IV secretory pathway component VirB8
MITDGKVYKIGKCKTLKDYKVYNTDIIYYKWQHYIYEYHPDGKYGPYYVVFINPQLSTNINAKAFKLNFKKLYLKKKKNESTSTGASKTSKGTKSRNTKARLF